MDGWSVQTVVRKGIIYSEVSVYCWMTKVSTINQGKKRYNNFMLYRRTKFFNHQQQLMVNLRVKEVYASLLCVFLTCTVTRWNFKVVYASLIYFGSQRSNTVILSVRRTFTPQREGWRNLLLRDFISYRLCLHKMLFDQLREDEKVVSIICSLFVDAFSVTQAM
jgi:hypothetical protein